MTLDEEDWRQLLFDFRWSGTARSHWLARYGRTQLAAFVLKAIACSKPALARDLIVFLEENFDVLTSKKASNVKVLLFASCEALNSIVVSQEGGRPDSQRLRCQAITTITMMMVSSHAFVEHKRLFSSFVTLLLSVVARAAADKDRNLRLTACECLRLIECEYRDANFVVPMQIVRFCELETTHAVQGYVRLLAGVMRKLAAQTRDGKPSDARQTLLRQAMALILARLELLSPAASLSILDDVLAIAAAAGVSAESLAPHFAGLLH